MVLVHFLLFLFGTLFIFPLLFLYIFHHTSFNILFLSLFILIRLPPKKNFQNFLLNCLNFPRTFHNSVTSSVRANCSLPSAVRSNCVHSHSTACGRQWTRRYHTHKTNCLLYTHLFLLFLSSFFLSSISPTFSFTFPFFIIDFTKLKLILSQSFSPMFSLPTSPAPPSCVWTCPRTRRSTTRHSTCAGRGRVGWTVKYEWLFLFADWEKDVGWYYFE